MALTLNHIFLAYGDKPVLEDVSCVFPERGCVLLPGPSGCGKTTLLRLVAGLVAPDRGEVTGGGEVSFAFQEYRLFPSLTAAENIAVAASGQKKHLTDAEAMLLSLGFTKKETALYPAALSGGMKQRVSLARAFLRRAPILLLDEPFKELDGALIETVIRKIRKESEERLVILSAHSGAQAKILDAQVLPFF